MRIHHSYVLLPLIFAAGCGRQERSEALSLCKALDQQKAGFASTNGLERELLNGTRAWTGDITSAGAGKAAELAGKAQAARDLVKSADAVSSGLGQLREAISKVSLTKEGLQQIRADLNDQITKRQRYLQEVRSLLEGCAKGFLQLQQNRQYAGDSYPGEVGKLDQMLQPYKGPQDIVAGVMADLKTKYGITDADLAK